MILIDGKTISEKVYTEISQGVLSFKDKFHRPPKLVVILIGDDPASQIYTSAKEKKALAVGMEHETLRFQSTVQPAEVFQAVTKLNNDPTVDGILIQRPLPSQFNEQKTVYWIAPEKDVDAFHPLNVGKLSLDLECLKPCTPLGIIRLLKEYNIPLSGKTACVIGRSALVGKPIATLLLQENCTLFHCHSKTKELPKISSQADILIVAAGRAHLIDSAYIKKDATVIDVGIHRDKSGKVIGDVDFEKIKNTAYAITPVPGGVGPMTVAMLLQNTLTAAIQQSKNS